MAGYKSDPISGSVPTVRSAIEPGPALELIDDEVSLRIDPDLCNGVKLGPNGGLSVEQIAIFPDGADAVTGTSTWVPGDPALVVRASVTITNPATIAPGSVSTPNCRNIYGFVSYEVECNELYAHAAVDELRLALSGDHGGSLVELAHTEWTNVGSWGDPTHAHGPAASWNTYGIIGPIAPGESVTVTGQLDASVVAAGGPLTEIAEVRLRIFVSPIMGEL